MNNICTKIWNKAILDSEIIQEMESAKRKDSGFDINMIGCDHNWSSLMVAVFWNRKGLVEYILSDSNTNINHSSDYGNTALHFCKDVSILKPLLSRRNIDVNIQGRMGRTGLHRYCIFEYKTCTKELLLDVRINTSIHDWHGDTARDCKNYK